MTFLLDITTRQQAIFSPLSEKDPGSVEWCYQMLGLLKLVYEQREKIDGEWHRHLDEIVEQEAWTKIPEDNPYGSFDAMLRAELGVGEQDVAERRRRETIELAKNGKAPAKTGRPDKGTQRLPLSKGSNDRRVAQIAKRRPDILKRMQQGEFPSVRAAALEAGIVKKDTATYPHASRVQANVWGREAGVF